MFKGAQPLWPQGEAPHPDFCGEDERLNVMGAYGLSGLEDDDELSRIARFAARLCETPVALVSLVHKEEQRFLAREGLEARATPRPTSFCAHAMLETAPMVIKDATKDPRFADNPLVTGAPDIRFYAGAPLVSHEGAPLGSLCVIDTKPREKGLTGLQFEGLTLLAEGVMRRLEARRAALLNEEKFILLADNMPDLAWSCDTDGNFDFYNRRWEEFVGNEGPSDAEGWRPLVHPDDRDAAFARWYDDFATGHAFEMEFRMRRKDGEWRWVISRALPMVGEDGVVTRWFGTVTDIDETRDLSDARDLLSKELSHRIKNIFAVISGLVAIKSRQRPEAREFAADLSSTINALGLAHDYVRPHEGRRGESLNELLGDLLAPYQDRNGERIAITGENARIGTRAATPLALVFHELATNSAKYGALSCEEGTIVITTTLSDDGERAEIAWREFALPCDDYETKGEGFGSRMLRMAIEGQLGGNFRRQFGRDGLEIDITLPIARMAE